MTSLSLHDFAMRVFVAARAAGLSIGVAELLDMLRVVDSKYVQTTQALQDAMCLVWINSPMEETILMKIFDDVNHIAEDVVPPNDLSSEELSRRPQDEIIQQLNMPTEPDRRATQITSNLDVEIHPLPLNTRDLFQANPLAENSGNLHTYWPVSQRFMRYTWRYLRRSINDGPQTEFDLDATINLAIQHGRFLGPVFKRQITNHAHLVLIVDRKGSMTPFHRYVDEIVDTAFNHPSLLVDVFYFGNIPSEPFWKDPYLTLAYPDKILETMLDEFTSVLFVSDAGAARGTYVSERVLQTGQFLRDIFKITNHVAWLNPMPQYRWQDTSAEFIQDFVPMYSMNQEGFANAVDILRGIKF